MAVIKATDTDFNEVLTSNEKVVVKYYADWCGNCRLFSPKFKRMSDDEQFTNVAFVDVNAETSPDARKLAGVTNLPFFAVFKNGELVDTVAASKEDAVRDLIHKLNA
jgi:thiol-disulfide isomerase/thioredoxin